MDSSLETAMRKPVKITPVWHVIILFTFLHVEAFRGLFYIFKGYVMWQTLAFAFLLYTFSGIGVVAGVHRLWSHRAYKARAPLRILLLAFHTLAYQFSAIRWSRDHRVHHKFTDTNADPYNIKRGFFFAHIGWVLCRKHPAVIEAGKRVDISDLTGDWMLRFQHRYFFIISPLLCFVMPTLVSSWLWGESFVYGWTVAACLRFVLYVHATFCINSVAHTFGYKPYDKSMTARQSLLGSIITTGEGWHNFHHVFPHDYRSDEFGSKNFNLSAMFIEMMAKIGWAYDLKTTPQHLIEARMKKTGNGESGKDFVENLRKCAKLELLN